MTRHREPNRGWSHVPDGGAPNWFHGAESGQVGLASMLSPIRAQIDQLAGVGWTLTMSPAMVGPTWRAVSARTARADAAALLWTPSDGHADASSARRGLRQAALRRSVRPLADFSDESGERIILTPEAANVLMDSLIDPDLHAVLVDGVIDVRDADAMCVATSRGESPLTQECRAAAHVHATRGGPLIVESRNRSMLAAIVAGALRDYASHRLNRRARGLQPPPEALVDRMFARSNAICIRPIETEVLPGSLDIGVNTRRTSAPEPADWSLVYDLFGASWHDAGEVHR